jgi:hypothetical protein
VLQYTGKPSLPGCGLATAMTSRSVMNCKAAILSGVTSRRW